jgi:hypothetical protein
VRGACEGEDGTEREVKAKKKMKRKKKSCEVVVGGSEVKLLGDHRRS